MSLDVGSLNKRVFFLNLEFFLNIENNDITKPG